MCVFTVQLAEATFHSALQAWFSPHQDTLLLAEFRCETERWCTATCVLYTHIPFHTKGQGMCWVTVARSGFPDWVPANCRFLSTSPSISLSITPSISLSQQPGTQPGYCGDTTAGFRCTAPSNTLRRTVE